MDIQRTIYEYQNIFEYASFPVDLSTIWIFRRYSEEEKIFMEMEITSWG
jgi:hypothetical protein